VGGYCRAWYRLPAYRSHRLRPDPEGVTPGQSHL